MHKKILITGGAGFIGSNFIRFLLKELRNKNKGLSVINLDKLTYSGNLANLKDIEKDSRYKFVKGDICDKRLVEKVVKGCSMVVNFAAESHVDRSISDAEIFIKSNVLGTQVLLDACRKYNVKKYIQISTDEVYGSIKKGRFKEADNLRPNSPYAASKAAADLLCRSYYITHELPVVIVRSCNNFGPYQYPEKIMPLFITNLMEDKKVPVYADGKNSREWIYVVDNCRAINKVMEKGKPGEVYNIGSGKELKNIDLTKKIIKALNKNKTYIKFVKDRPGHDMRYALSSKKINDIGWKPEYNFNKALSLTVDWYRKNPRWWKKLKKKPQKKFW